MPDGTINKYDLISDEALKVWQQFNDLLQTSVIDLKQVIDSITNLNVSLGQKKTTTKEVNDEETKYQTLLKQAQEAQQKTIQLSDIEKTAKQQYLIVQEQVKQSRKAESDQAKVSATQLQQETSLIKGLELQMKQLKQQRDAVSKSDTDGISKIQSYNKEINALGIQHESLMSKREQDKIGVGRYAEALDTLSPKFGQIRTSIAEVIGVFSKLGIAGAVIAGIGVVAAAITAPLKAFWDSTQEGMDRATIRAAGLSGAMDVLTGKLAGVGKAIDDTFSDEKGAKTSHFWELFGLTIDNTLKYIGIWTNATQNLGMQMDKESNKAKDIARQRIELEKEEIGLIAKRAQSDMNLKAARLAAQDETKTIKEKIELNNKVLKIEQEITDSEVKSAEKRLAIELQEQERKTKLGLDTREIDRKVEESKANISALKEESDARQIRLDRSNNTLKKQLEKEDTDLKLANINIKEKEQLESNKRVLADSQSTLDQKIAAENSNKDIALKILKVEEDAKLNEMGIDDIKRQTILKEYETKRYNLIQETEDKITKLTEDKNKKFQSDTEDKNKKFQSDYDSMIKSVMNKNSEIEKKDEEDRIANLNKKSEQRIKLLESESKNEIGIFQLSNIEKEQILLNGLRKEKELREQQGLDIIGIDEKIKETELRIDADKQKALGQAATTAANMLKSLINDYFNTEISNIEQSQKETDDKFEAEKAKRIAAGENETQVDADINNRKTKIDKKYQHDIAVAKRKQAEFDKAEAMIQTGIAGAEAVIKAMDAGWPVGIILAAVTGAMVIAQEAAIASKPLPDVPSFKKGTDSSPEGFAILHGQELATLPSGKSYLTPGGINDPIGAYLPKGTKVTPNDILRSQLNTMMLEQHSGVDLRETNSHLSEIKKQGSKRGYINGKGQYVEQNGNITRIYVN